MQRKCIALCVAAVCCLAVSAAPKDLRFVDGENLTLINKTIETPDRYTRVDTTQYDGFTNYQRRELTQHSCGLALCFKTNSSSVYARPTYRLHKKLATQTGVNSEGFCLYIKKNGKWKYAGANTVGKDGNVSLVTDMAPGEKECILYLPNLSVLDKVEIGVDRNASLEAMPNPFRHKIVVFGSSFTHGVGCSRPGMSYPMQLERATGLHVCDFGMSGNSKLQQSYARVLADTEADAFLFDAFSNPSVKEIEERFVPFVKTIREKHPTTPLIFMQTIYRDYRNFNTKKDRYEQAKMNIAEKMVKEAMKTDPNIFWIVPNVNDGNETSADGIHPNDYGYTLWMESIRPQLTKILSRRGIK
jgi:hypothetical protein